VSSSAGLPVKFAKVEAGMPFPVEALGLQLKPHEWNVSTRAVLAYAAGLGASEAAYLDDAQPGGLRALPFQCVSPEWPVLVSMRHATQDILTPSEAARGVHARCRLGVSARRRATRFDPPSRRPGAP
jgi:hypothetical protein